MHDIIPLVLFSQLLLRADRPSPSSTVTFSSLVNPPREYRYPHKPLSPLLIRLSFVRFPSSNSQTRLQDAKNSTTLATTSYPSDPLSQSQRRLNNPISHHRLLHHPLRLRYCLRSLPLQVYCGTRDTRRRRNQSLHARPVREATSSEVFRRCCISSTLPRKKRIARKTTTTKKRRKKIATTTTRKRTQIWTTNATPAASSSSKSSAKEPMPLYFFPFPPTRPHPHTH